MASSPIGNRLLGSWMSLMVAVTKPLCGYMGVNLGGGETSVSEQLLYAANVRSRVEQVSGEAMTKRMRARAQIEAHERPSIFQAIGPRSARKAACRFY